MDINKIANSGALKVKPYVPGRSAAEVMKEYGLSKVIKLASNESALGVPEKSIEALKKAADKFSVYPDPVSNDLRIRLAGIHSCNPDCITVANGVDGLLYLLGMAVINEGDECIYPEITFPMYDNIVKVMHGVPIRSAMAGSRIDLNAILTRITPKTKMLFLTNPNNPTGDALPAEDIRAFLKKVPSEILVVMDEAYIEFAEPETDPDSVGLFNRGMDNLVILRTFSKIYGLAGIRVGYGIAHPDLIALIHAIKPPFTVSAAAQAMAIAALDSSDYYSRVINDVKVSREYFYSRLDKMGLEYVRSNTNFILINTGFDSKELSEKLLEKGVIVRPTGGYKLPISIRVTFGTSRQNEIFFDSLEGVLDEMSTDNKGDKL